MVSVQLSIIIEINCCIYYFCMHHMHICVFVYTYVRTQLELHGFNLNVLHYTCS